MKNRIERMNEEANQLEDKILKLSAFITESDEFETLDRREKVRLIVQLEYMNGYYDTLSDRIIASVDGERGR
ncbi:hypothetical protein RJD39_15675 [Vibrio scophthalmi]|uniref:crAss001_48 related protein n=1 Tax=Vibrio scophthalmi TaxID=45658 RepID=UPI003872F8A1